MDGIILFLAGLGLLVVGAELVVLGGANLAKSLGVKPLLIGLTVVAVGTSVPELAVGITASLQGTGSLAVGNIAGTNIFNILFIMALSAAIVPIVLHNQIFTLELPVIVMSSIMMLVFSLDQRLSQLDGFIMVICAILYTIVLIKLSLREPNVNPVVTDSSSNIALSDNSVTKRARLINSAVLIAGIAISVFGAHWLVDGAVNIARSLHLSEAIIGLTIVAIGTSAPELVTTIVATLKGERDIAIGNLLGSSIYNILFILGITCIATPGGIDVAEELLWLDIPLMLAVMFACIPIFYSHKTISRAEGILGVSLYIIYMGWLVAYRT